MKSYHYELVNVFAETHWGGNPLAVFLDADELPDEQMQAIAKQMNLSEVVFIQTPTAESAVKKLRIFTPDYEIPFAGHPTIGAAVVLREKLKLTDQFILETNSQLAHLNYHKGVMLFSVPVGSVENAPLTKAECAEILGLPVEKIASQASWVNTGVSQLLVQLTDFDAIKRVQIQTALFMQKALSKDGTVDIYVWSEQDNIAKVRLFFALGGMVVEDPGTGSAAANLGSWCLQNGLAPLNWQLHQGDEINRPNRLSLQADVKIKVGGKVITVGNGTIFVP